MFDVSPNLDHIHGQMLTKVLSSLCNWLLRKVVPDHLQCGSKFPDRWSLFSSLLGFSHGTVQQVLCETRMCVVAPSCCFTDASLTNQFADKTFRCQGDKIATAWSLASCQRNVIVSELVSQRNVQLPYRWASNQCSGVFCEFRYQIDKILININFCFFIHKNKMRQQWNLLQIPCIVVRVMVLGAQ